MKELSLKSFKLEGQLSKYTNVMRGYQFRYFVVNTELSRLDYFMSEDMKAQRPRGSIELKNSIISPSDEDSTTFTINTTENEVFKLRALDAKERQNWVNVLRLVSQQSELAVTSSVMHSQGKDLNENPSSLSTYSSYKTGDDMKSGQQVVNLPTVKFTNLELIREVYNHVKKSSQNLDKAMNNLPNRSSKLCKYDKDILLLKATTRSCINCIVECCNILRINNKKKLSITQTEFKSQLLKLDQTCKNLIPKTTSLIHPESGLRLQASTNDNSSFHTSDITNEASISSINMSKDEITDNEDDQVDILKANFDDYSTLFEQNKSQILHILPNLKVGMDLTKISLPLFMLEGKSLLEAFADYMAHPDLFVKIAEEKTPEDRMVALLDWYLTCFHQIRKNGMLIKKPYNPVIGEVFNCSWRVNNIKPGSDDASHSSSSSSSLNENSTCLITYTSEQVSHHPSISAFYVECKEKQIKLNGSIYTKSKYLGMSISVELIGQLILKLEKYNEEYIITLPSCYVRSIVTTPWLELGDNCVIICPQSGMSALIDFQVKSFYGEKMNQINVKIKNKLQEVICKINGQWDGLLEYEFLNIGNKKVNTKKIDAKTLKITKKRVRPIELQDRHESRRLWSKVTESLHKNDMQSATNFKNVIEKNQRFNEKTRRDKDLEYESKYFKKCPTLFERNSNILKMYLSSLQEKNNKELNHENPHDTDDTLISNQKTDNKNSQNSTLNMSNEANENLNDFWLHNNW